MYRIPPAAVGGGVELKATANAQTTKDGVVSGSIKTVGGSIGLSGQATVNLNLGPKDAGDHPMSVSGRLGLVGATLSSGDKGTNVQLSVGPQLGGQIQVAGGVRVGLTLNSGKIDLAAIWKAIQSAMEKAANACGSTPGCR